ncbi:MAG TPA: thioredoxin domain-containing protein, partial [Methanobacterium sp.]|nr:thioredoxin domain-containing protein [Methanobacterium sp.]
MSPENKLKKSNHLINEKSPYLIQHTDNPVDWYPWSKEAFKKAKSENKPIFLSIGYSTCHWCHVMAHESFEDPEIGNLMNEVFVSIKVDREERPDLDNIYMTVCQLMTGTGGWPLTVIMTPDKKPFFAGTYFPKISMYGRVGLKDLILNIRDIWNERPEEVFDSADQIIEAL